MFLVQFFSAFNLFLTHQGHVRIGGHYFHAWCLSVCPSENKKCAATLTLMLGKQNTRYDGHHSWNNDHHLAGAWWVIINSPDLLTIFLWIFRNRLLLCILPMKNASTFSGFAGKKEIGAGDDVTSQKYQIFGESKWVNLDKFPPLLGFQQLCLICKFKKNSHEKQ